MDHQNPAPPRQEAAGNGSAPASSRNGSLRPLLLLLVLILLLFLALLAVSVNSAMTASQLEDRVEQMENTVKQLETRLSEAKEEPTGASLPADTAEPEDTAAVEDEILPRSVAHRGFSDEAPENTLPAFLLAWRQGFRYVETDIQFTVDGFPVLLHDQSIERTSNGSGLIDEMTLEQAQQYDFGSWMSEEFAGTQIPTLENFLRLCRFLHLQPYLELKGETVTPERVPALVELVKSLGMEKQVSWISFSFDLLDAVRKCDENARLGYLAGSVGYNEITKAMLLSGGPGSVFLDSAGHSEEECRLCRENGIPLEVWTIDSADEILALDPYISGVTSNSLIASDILNPAGSLQT